MDIIDPEAAVVVRRIFDEALAGKKSGAIARGLNEDGIKTPGQHFREMCPENGRFAYMSEKSGWTHQAVYCILRRFTYTGASVGGLRRQLMPCKKVSTKASREEWVVVPDMHEAIVTVEEYEKAQQSIDNGKAHNYKPTEMYPLRSLIVCGICGRHMIRYKKTGRFNCPYGRNAGNEECKGHRSHTDNEMEKIVFRAIKDFVAVRDAGRKADKRLLIKRRLEVKKNRVSVDELEGKITLLKRNKLDLYEQYCIGRMDKLKYLAEKSSIDKKMEENEEAIRANKLKMEDCIVETNGVSSEADAVCEVFRDADELTYDMAHAFIERIIVYRGDRLEIVWRFKNNTNDDEKETV